MTDKQIKQNAEQYAEEHAVSTDGGGWEEEYDYEEQEAAYIAGAHSRDEEIERLKNRLALFNDDLDKALYRKEKFRQKNKRAQQHIKYLQTELNKLSNPWISVEERLPEKGRWVVLRGSKTGHPYVNKYIGGRKWGGWRCFMPKVTKWKYVDE